MPSLFLLFVFFLVFTTGETLTLVADEQNAVYSALESVDPFTNWHSLYSGDLCNSGPHGVVCDVFTDEASSTSALHVTELNFGFVSDFASNPSCSVNATLPSSFSSLPFLRKIFFYNCFFGTETYFGSASLKSLPLSLTEIVFINNPALTGRFSGEIGNFANLKRLIFTGSAIYGPIPEEVGNLRNLNQLELSSNRLVGTIPRSVGNLERVRILDLSGNRITGGIPSQIGLLGELVKLDLSSNRISGPVPYELSGLKKVELLDLSWNRLTGGIPTAVGEMVSLKEVYLSGNRLGGEIPEIWGNVKGILGIGMSRNGLVGNIPGSMGLVLEKLCYLGLDGNLLQGQVPEQFKRLEGSASEINLEGNRLEGRIPFSAGFVMRMGGKLKVGGNGKLCLGEELVGHVRGSVGELVQCNKKEEIPRPVLFSAASSSSPSSPLVWGVLLLVLALTG